MIVKMVMNKEDFKKEAEGKDSAELIRFAFEVYGKLAAVGTSLQKTGSVIIDLASRSQMPYSVFFIDTLCNHEETIEALQETERKYGIAIQRLYPAEQDIEKLYEELGQHSFYSKFGRERCCEIRKKRPLNKKLAELEVWISGLRADQSEHREVSNEKVTIIRREGREIIKINPLFDWTEADVDSYIKTNDVPYNRLYDFVSPYGERYKEIGCACCHIPVKDGAAKRAGKFPWEESQKECGLHTDGSGI